MDWLEPLYGQVEVDLHYANIPRKLREEWILAIDEFVRAGKVRRVFRADGIDYEHFLDIPETPVRFQVIHSLVRSPSQKTVILLYGEMGAGKNYQGSRLADALGFSFLDGDDALPSELVERVRSFKPLTPKQLDAFIQGNLFEAITQSSHPTGIVVAQALYLRSHRSALIERLRQHGFNVESRRIRVPFWQNVRQLWSRPNGAKWVAYWLLNKPFFQK